MTQAGIEPATFRFVAQCLNHCALQTGRLYNPGNASGSHFCYILSRPQGHTAIGMNLCQWKLTMTPAGIEPVTHRFVAQCLNHCATAVPPFNTYMNIQCISQTQQVIISYFIVKWQSVSTLIERSSGPSKTQILPLNIR